MLRLIADLPVFAPRHANIGQVLALMNERRTEFVVLVDEYGGVAGIVTLRDVTDDLMGLVDESKVMIREALIRDLSSETAPPATNAAPVRRTVRGDLPLHELARLLELNDWRPETNAATVAGLIQMHLAEIGKPGDEVIEQGVRLRIAHSDTRAIHQVDVEVLAPTAEAE